MKCGVPAYPLNNLRKFVFIYYYSVTLLINKEKKYEHFSKNHSTFYNIQPSTALNILKYCTL